MAGEMVPMEEYVADTRAAIMDRARYMALLVDEMDRRGLDTDDIVSKALYARGLEMGKQAAGIKGADEFIKSQMSSRLGRRAFETERGEMTTERAVLLTHRCPLVDVWREMGLSDPQVVRMCNLLENRDEGRVVEPGLDLKVDKRIARGDPVCEYVFTKK